MQAMSFEKAAKLFMFVRAIFLFFSYVVMSVLTTEWCCRIAVTGVKGTSFGVPLLFDPGRAYGF